MKVAVFSTHAYDRNTLVAAAGDAAHELHFVDVPLSWETRALAAGFSAICVFVNDKLDAPLLEYLKQGLRLIALRCAGFNNVDLPTAGRLGITVMRVPAYSPHAVAEHAVALIMTLNRKTHKAYNRVREHNYSLERLEGFDMYGRTVGVVGTGHIGQVFATIMKGFGCKVLAYDLYPSEDLKQRGVTYVSLPELLAESDIVSLHCPLTPETHHMIQAETLAMMKPTAMLINTSRGGLIDTKAVIESLKHRQLGYLGIDVYEQEEALFFKDLSEVVFYDGTIARLMSFPNVLITAHQAFFTQNALQQIAETTIGNITDFEAGRSSANQVTAAVVR
jgi:D-lactate dehydrogenase